MTSTPAIATLYPVMLALANIGVGVGLYLTGTLVFAVPMWIAGSIVLIGLLSSVAPGFFPTPGNTRYVSHRHPK